jgi:hypothetical protein
MTIFFFVKLPNIKFHRISLFRDGKGNLLLSLAFQNIRIGRANRIMEKGVLHKAVQNLSRAVPCSSSTYLRPPYERYLSETANASDKIGEFTFQVGNSATISNRTIQAIDMLIDSLAISNCGYMM